MPFDFVELLYIGMTEKQEIFTLMDGRIKMRRGRYNPTSDAVWLASFISSTPKTILDVGIGTGAVALCASVRNPSAQITGIDVSSEMLTECASNAALNGINIELILGDILNWKTDRTFDLVMTNPPYFKGSPAHHNAHHNADLGAWTARCVARVRPRGTFITIVDAACTATVISAMTHACGDIQIFPLFGAKNTAERVLIGGRVGTKGGSKIYQGLSMNTDAILRDGLTIDAILAMLGQS